jgi:hypothetical protein
MKWTIAVVVAVLTTIAAGVAVFALVYKPLPTTAVVAGRLIDTATGKPTRGTVYFVSGRTYAIESGFHGCIETRVVRGSSVPVRAGCAVSATHFAIVGAGVRRVIAGPNGTYSAVVLPGLYVVVASTLKTGECGGGAVRIAAGETIRRSFTCGTAGPTG